MRPAPWHDRLWVALTGGVRIRLAGGDASVVGKVAGPPPPRLVELVRELARDEEGVVHLHREHGGRWRIATRGALASASFEQRLRNVLGNP